MKNRKSNRLENYDYSQNGMYFATICAKNKDECLGKIENGKMILNEIGKILETQLHRLKKQYSNINMDCYAIMPNHLHLIIEINNDIKNKNVGADLVSAHENLGQTQGLSLRNVGLLSKIIQGLKSKTSVEYIKLMKSKNKYYQTKIWQRSFYDHIIRNEMSLNKIREYMITNPEMWERDRNNAENIFM